MTASGPGAGRPQDATTPASPEWSEAHLFSFIRGGPIYRLLRAVGLTPTGFRGAMLLSAILIGICLVPIVVLTAADGTLFGDHVTMPLARDVAALGRFFVALPALVLIAPDSDMLSRRALAHFLSAGLVKPGSRPAFFQTLRDVQRLRDSVWPELALVALAFVPAVLTVSNLPLVGPIEGWRFDADQRATWAGVWFEFVAKPIWLLIALLWIWRLVLWTTLLARVCRLDLALHAAHPDGAGGLGFLSGMQQRFSKFTFAGGVVLAGAAANEMLYRDATLQEVGWILLAYVVFAMLVMCMPLFALAPRLASLKRAGVLAYGALGNEYLRAFESKWLGEPERAARRGAAPADGALDELGGEYGTLTDINAAYLIVRRLSIVPIDKAVIVGIAVPAVLPMVPVAFLAFGAPEIVKQLFAMLG